MASRNKYWVVPSGSAWQVKFESRVLTSHARKEDAVFEGQRVAKANQPSQLLIMRADGTIEREYTYGNDPFPPRG